jgi:hypothetical protein
MEKSLLMTNEPAQAEMKAPPPPPESRRTRFGRFARTRLAPSARRLGASGVRIGRAAGTVGLHYGGRAARYGVRKATRPLVDKATEIRLRNARKNLQVVEKEAELARLLQKADTTRAEIARLRS